MTTKMKVLFVVAAVAIIATGIFIYAFMFSKDKAVVGVNLYDRDVVVSMDGQQKTLAPYEEYEFITSNNNVTVAVTEEDGTEIETRTHELGNDVAVVYDLLGDDPDQNYCFVEANITNTFYETGEQANSGYTTVTDEATKSVVHGLGTFGSLDNYVVPTKYDGEFLPESISEDTSIYGIYPLDCADLDSQETVDNNVFLWTFLGGEALSPLEDLEL